MLRDGLALNQGDDMAEEMDPKMRDQMSRMQLMNKLKNLPKPDEVEISMPELEGEDPVAEQQLEEDAEDRDRRQAAEEAAKREAERLLHEEMAGLVTRDAFLFPVKGAKPPKKMPELRDPIAQDLLRAKELLAANLAEFAVATGGDAATGVALQAVAEDGLG